MKRLTESIRLAALVALTALCCPTGRAQIATWNNSTGDNDWNNALNWDIGVPAEGTNAVIGAANTVNYNTPMTATSFGMLDLNSAVLSVNAAGFSPNATGAAIAIQSTTAGDFPTNGLYVGNGGVVSITNGSLVLTNNSVVSVAAGGSFTINGTLQVGGVSGNNDLRVCVTNNGGVLSALTTTLNPNNAAGSQVNLGAAVYILGGTNDLGDVTIRRAPAGSGEANDLPGRQGLVISNGLVRTTSLDVGGPNGNSWLSMVVAGGRVTNSGNFTVRTTGTANRGSRFRQFGGLFVSPGTNNVHLRGQTAQNGLVTYAVSGGTNIVNGFVVSDAGDTVGTVNMTNAAKIYIGSGGMTMEGTLTATNIMLNNGGIFGATDNWTGTVPINLNGGTIDAADLGGTPRNISLSGVLRGAGALNKNGGGTLTLNGANTYSGNTLINAGTLALGSGGSIASSSQIIVAGGASFDVSAVSGFTLGGGRTLGGSGTVVGAVALASGGIISPGTSPGTMTLASALTETGGAVNHFDLPTTPGPGNDLLVINGTLNVSGINTIEIVGGGSPGTVHTLIQYGGSFNGTLANFTISGTTGILSNNPTTKTISLVVQSAIRGPTNVVWVGNSVVNDWDTVNRTNWLNAGTLDFFVFGDSVLFGATGAANPIVNVVGNVSPASTTVGAAAHYTFSGSGNITGIGGLTKTNTGTLTILTTNAYTGVTTIGGGALEVSLLAIGGANSGIGAASVDPNNLVIDGGTLRYLGGSVTTDRGATINTGGATIDVTTSGTTLTAGGLVNGSGALTKAGPGTLVLSGANGYSGGTVVNAGQLQVAANTAAGLGGITNNGATLRIQGALTLDNAMNFSGTCTLDIGNAGGNTATRGAWSGSGTVNFVNVDPNNRTVTIGGAGAGGGHMWDFSGTVDYGTNSGFFRINNDNSTFNFGSSNATFNVGTGTATLNQRNGGTTTHFGALIGGPNTRLSGRGNTGASGTTTYSIGGNNLSTTFAGVIDNGSGTTAITKVGTGTLILSGNSTYTGTTIVMDGTLQVDGQVPSSIVTVLGGRLAGNGTFGLSVDVEPGGTLSPGNSIGLITVNGLTLQPGSTNFMELNKGAATNDVVVSSSSIAYGGTLMVTNLAGTLADGDSFKLFDALPGNYFGTFDTIILPAVAAPLAWDTSGLTLDGTIKLLVPHESRPMISIAKIEGSNFVLRGTNNGNSSTYYYVLTSTNIASPLSSWTPLATNQFEVDGTFAVTNAFNSSEPRRFYLLKTP